MQAKHWTSALGGVAVSVGALVLPSASHGAPDRDLPSIYGGGNRVTNGGDRTTQVLIQRLTAAQPAVRQAAAGALGASTGLASIDAVRALQSALKNERDPEVRAAIDAALAKLTADDVRQASPEVIVRLVRQLGDENPVRRAEAAAALGRLGAAAMSAKPALQKLIADPDEMVASAAADALRLIPDPDPFEAKARAMDWRVLSPVMHVDPANVRVGRTTTSLQDQMAHMGVLDVEPIRAIIFTGKITTPDVNQMAGPEIVAASIPMKYAVIFEGEGAPFPGRIDVKVLPDGNIAGVIDLKGIDPKKVKSIRLVRRGE
jgi:hypothetical protein